MDTCALTHEVDGLGAVPKEAHALGLSPHELHALALSTLLNRKGAEEKRPLCLPPVKGGRRKADKPAIYPYSFITAWTMTYESSHGDANQSITIRRVV